MASRCLVPQALARGETFHSISLPVLKPSTWLDFSILILWSRPEHHGKRPCLLPRCALLSPDASPARNSQIHVLFAYKRFGDIIPLAIDHEFVFGVGRDMSQVLYKGIEISGLSGRQICEDFAQEPLNVSARRETLRNQLERLGRARQELLNVRL